MDGTAASIGKNIHRLTAALLEMIRDHIAANLIIDTEDFDYAPFAQEGGLGKVHQLFSGGLETIIEKLNEALVA